MSLLLWAIVVIVIIVVFGLLLRLLEGVAKIVLTVVLVGLVLAVGAWILVDINDLRQHFYQDDKLFLLDINGELEGAFVLGGDAVPKPIADLGGLRSAYPDLAAVQDGNYKVIVLEWPVVAGALDVPGFSATEKELHAALRSRNPKQLFIDKMVARFDARMLGQITAEADRLYPTDDAFASTIFALLAGEPLRTPDVIFAGLSQGTVRVHPETVTFKIMKVLPEGMSSVLLPSA